MSEPIRDPVSRVRMSFEPEGENLIVTLWLEPGGGLPAHFHPRQEERWSVVEGTVRFRLGDDERVIGPEEGEIRGPARDRARARQRERSRGPAALPGHSGASPAELSRGERSRGSRGPVHAQRAPARAARRALGGGISEALSRRNRVRLAAAVRAAHAHRSAGSGCLKWRAFRRARRAGSRCAGPRRR